MKTKKVAAMMPLLAGIGLGIVSLSTPFLLANHYIWVETTRYSADNYLFFFWGKYYTVSGTNLIQSAMTYYDFGDFPIYPMIAIIIALILGTMSILGGRGLILNVKGREIKLKFDINPIWLQTYSAALLILAYVYMNDAVMTLIIALQMNNYVVEFGPSLDFLLGSLVAIGMSAVMTTVKLLKAKEVRK